MAATPAVVDGLTRRLAEDDSDWVRMEAARALGQLGAAAAPAGGALLRAAQTGEAGLREEAMRALAVAQPPEFPDAQVFLLDRKTLATKLSLKAEGAMAITPDSEEIVVGSKIYRVKDGSLLQDLATVPNGVPAGTRITAAAFYSSGERLVLMDAVGQTYFFNR